MCLYPSGLRRRSAKPIFVGSNPTKHSISLKAKERYNIGYIYKITNIKNNKSYIGQTRATINHRYATHWYSALNENSLKYPLYEDMRRLGKENFIIEQIEECPNDQLNDREKYWINYFDTYNNGYNQTKGGAGQYKGKIIYCFTLKGRLYKIYPDAFTASKDTGINLNIIKSALYCGGLTGGGYQWFFEESKDLVQNLTEKIDSYGKIDVLTLQYDLEGNFIKSFNTMKDAEKETGVQTSGISRCISGEMKVSGGYQWKRGFHGEEIPLKISSLKITNKTLKKGNPQKVICNFNGKEKLYNSLSSASRGEQLSRGKITRCCNIYPNTTCTDGRTFRYVKS